MSNLNEWPRTTFALNPKPPEPVKWNFPPTGGGIAQGFNDSGKEFFKANVMEHVVRELLQNSLDAKDPRHNDKPVTVNMSTMTLSPGVINSRELAKHMEKSLEQTTKQGSQKGVEAYKESLKLLKKSKIPTLAVIDKYTTGLQGDKWNALVYQEGTPNKDGIAAGGSYGIGKNAPYAASKLSLVCYST